ncbi:protein yellow-like [Agrilus planipennis]|uniref:Protein yellow-like n=1 Tax=Agrilus planipennis TaxID=224129 RepID=A0A1W4WPZ3_AGRPL|nr:protein yellow-like [Agrilus planipennis]
MMFWCTSFLLVFFGANPILAIDNLRVVYQWNQLSYNYETESDKFAALDSGAYIPANNVPMGIEVVGRRIFITIPRWKRGVPASLAYISHTGEVNSPTLKPYPNWEAHQSENDSAIPEIVSPFRLRADRCGHLWVLDSGMANILEPEYQNSVPPSIIVFDLNDDSIVRR